MRAQTEAVAAMGSVALWGFSPALDFTVGSQDVADFSFWTKKSTEPVNILLVGVPDLCHLVQNLPEALRRTDRCVNFYILENSVEVYARQLLLLWLLAEPLDTVGLQEKVWMYMEIVGNTLLRPNTARYVETTASRLVELVTSQESTSLPLVSLSELLHRERDQLEAVFKSWRCARSEPDAARLWDLRLRQHLGQRYDARQGIFDWDYYMRLKDRLETEFVRPDEYKHWRETGVAFRRPGTEPTRPNRTLVTARLLGRPGERQLRRGYWGDLISGPYVSLGVRTDDPQMRRTRNGRPPAAAADVYAANLEALCHAVGDRLAGAAHVRVHLLPADGGCQLGRRGRFRRRFDAALFSSGMSHLLTPSLAGCLRDGAAVLLETARYLVAVSSEQQRLLLDRYQQLADTAGCQPHATPSVQLDRQRDQRSPAEIEEDRVAGPAATVTNGTAADGQEPVATDGEDCVRSPVVDDGVAGDSSPATTVDTSQLENVPHGDDSKHTQERISDVMKVTNPLPSTNGAEQNGNPSVMEDMDAKLSAVPSDIHEGGSPPSVPTSTSDKSLVVMGDAAEREVCAPLTTAGGGEPEIRGRELNRMLTGPERESKALARTLETEGEKPQTADGTGESKEEVEENVSSFSSVEETHVSPGSTRNKAVGNVNVPEDPGISTGQQGQEGPSAATDRELKRRWASDKLTSIPEWVRFVKANAEER